MRTPTVLKMLVILGSTGLVVELARASPWTVIAVASAAVITAASRIR